MVLDSCRRGDEGQTSSEYIGAFAFAIVIVLAAALAALTGSDVGQAVLDGTSRGICRVISVAGVGAEGSYHPQDLVGGQRRLPRPQQGRVRPMGAVPSVRRIAGCVVLVGLLAACGASGSPRSARRSGAPSPPRAEPR